MHLFSSAHHHTLSLAELLYTNLFRKDEGSNDEGPLSGPKYFMHDFGNVGTGHKFSELLMGLYFAKKNRLQYVFNAKTFVYNFRGADLQWLGDLIQRRYPIPHEWKSSDSVFDMDWKQWIPVYYYRNTTAYAYAQMNATRNELEPAPQGPFLGFGGRNNYFCPADDPKQGLDFNCFLTEFSFFNATRDLQDLLQTGDPQIERLAIHIRLGDITVSEKPETYVRAIEGMRRKLSIPLAEDQVHFIYYYAHDDPSDVRSEFDVGPLLEVRQALPGAHYHNVKSVEETLRFFVASKYMMTSGSSLSYLAAYFCIHCHVVITMPKEYWSEDMTEHRLRKNFYFMDEWTPVSDYL
ncbi:hypothetical protein EC968_003554 [Mortierella alpina]|nr:hypothetical protein EC968_003554 [Mortierella alpina]